jgi:hypothetical protein
MDGAFAWVNYRSWRFVKMNMQQQYLNGTVSPNKRHMLACISQGHAYVDRKNM